MPNGFILLTALIAVAIAEFAFEMSDCIDVRMESNVLDKKVLI